MYQMLVSDVSCAYRKGIVDLLFVWVDLWFSLHVIKSIDRPGPVRKVHKAASTDRRSEAHHSNSSRPRNMQHQRHDDVTRSPAAAAAAAPSTSATETFSSQWRRANSKRRPAVVAAALSHSTVPETAHSSVQAIDRGISSKQQKLTDAEKVEKHRMIVRRSYYQKKVWHVCVEYERVAVVNWCAWRIAIGRSSRAA